MHRKIVLALCLLQAATLFAQTETRKDILATAAKIHRQKEDQSKQKALALAAQKGWPLSFKSGINTAVLVGVDDAGYPIYLATESNLVAAATTGANQLWSGGASGLNLDGSSASLTDKLGIWDEGSVLNTHVEINGRVVQRDGVTTPALHHTHVAGTMIATGINPSAKGMAHGLQRMVSYSFANDESEMLGEAANLLLSNHSYGAIAGWYYNSTAARWEFHGRSGDNEDFKFGYYDANAQLFDSIAYNAPNYLIVKSSGNNRSQNGPAVGQPYWRFNSSGQMAAAGNRPGGISNNDGYDIISTYGTAKNILTVGAVSGLPNGYTQPSDVAISSFSSWGPTDDGRIKPDVVGDGVSVLSSSSTSTTSYASLSGTSMATPNVTGSLLLLQEYYNRLNPGNFMRSATLKAIAIHTADEAGAAAGPDYIYGWGLVNVAKGAQVIQSNNAGNHRILQNSLTSGQTFTTTVVASGQGKMVATIVWTDPKGDVAGSGSALNNPAIKLVNDLDLRITKGTTTYQPWVLDPALPSANATRGDNFRDNVERINIDDAVPGETYTVTITHKGTLARGAQAFSLIISGVTGQVYCTSGPSSSAGTRIDSVSFAAIQNANPPGCTTYKNFTNLSASVESAQTVPLRVRVGSCDASVTAKIVKVFIDYNSNGNFTDAGELVATSGVINGSGVFATNIVVPTTIIPGNSSIMRVVAQDATVAADVAPCGTYAAGETQDYRINFTAPTSDLSITDIEVPAANPCANASQLLTVKVRNIGGATKANFPLSATVRSGTTVVATLLGQYPSSLKTGEQGSFTFQTPFATVAGTTYSFTVSVNDPTDQTRNNDTLRRDITTAPTPAAPTGAGSICGTTANLRVTNPVAGANYFWYTAAAPETPITTGALATTTVIPANNQYSVGSGIAGTVGLISNPFFPGGYTSSSDSSYIRYSATAPLVLESARMYIKWPGRIELIVADVTPQTGGGYTYTALSNVTLDVYATSPAPAPGAQPAFDPQDAGAFFNINLPLPAGDHAIIVKPQGDANIFRNTGLTGGLYPFALPGVFSITGNSAQPTSDQQLYYYYLYNMRVRTADCISPKTTVTATAAPVPTVTMVGDSLESSAAAAYQWNRNNNPIPGATGRRHKPLQDGSYTVTITDANNCQRTSAAYNVTGTAINPVLNAEVGLKLGPNPNRGEFTVSFKVTTRENLTIELINAQGVAVLTKQFPSFTGNFTETFRRSDLPSGLYLLRVRHGKKVYHEKVSVQR